MTDEKETPKYVMLPEELFEDIIDAIESYEETIDGEWGFSRDAKELKEINLMPELYYKLLKYKL